MRDFIQQLPKAELHVHLEGTLEPEHIFALAERNGIQLQYSTPQEVVADNAFEVSGLQDEHKSVHLDRVDQVH